MSRKENIKEILLNDMDLTIGIIHDISNYNDRLSNAVYGYNNDIMLETYYQDAESVVEAMKAGKYNYNDRYIKIYNNGSAITLNESQLKKDIENIIDDIVITFIEYYEEVDIYLPEELENILSIAKYQECNKELFYYFKSIFAKIDDISLKELNDYLDEFKLMLSSITFYDDVVGEHNVKKLKKIIMDNNVFDMKYKDIPEYLNKIMNIIEFIVC